MQVTIIDGAGDRQADDVVDELLCSDLAGRQRGEGELEESKSKIVETTSGPAGDLPQTGLHYRVGDSEGQWDGVLTYAQDVFEISADGQTFTASAAFKFDRPRGQK